MHGPLYTSTIAYLEAMSLLEQRSDFLIDDVSHLGIPKKPKMFVSRFVALVNISRMGYDLSGPECAPENMAAHFVCRGEPMFTTKMSRELRSRPVTLIRIDRRRSGREARVAYRSSLKLKRYFFPRIKEWKTASSAMCACGRK